MTSGHIENIVGNSDERSGILYDIAAHVESFEARESDMTDGELREWLEKVARPDIDKLGKGLIENLSELCLRMTEVAKSEVLRGLAPLKPDSHELYAQMLDIPEELEDESSVSSTIFEIMRQAALKLEADQRANIPTGEDKKVVEPAEFEQRYIEVEASFDTIVTLLIVRNAIVDKVGIIKDRLFLPGIDNIRMKNMLKEHLAVAEAINPNPVFMQAVEDALMEIHDASVKRQDDLHIRRSSEPK